MSLMATSYPRWLTSREVRARHYTLATRREHDNNAMRSTRYRNEHESDLISSLDCDYKSYDGSDTLIGLRFRDGSEV